MPEEDQGVIRALLLHLEVDGELAVEEQTAVAARFIN
jgi:hypothetical protein